MEKINFSEIKNNLKKALKVSNKDEQLKRLEVLHKELTLIDAIFDLEIPLNRIANTLEQIEKNMRR